MERMKNALCFLWMALFSSGLIWLVENKSSYDESSQSLSFLLIFLVLYSFVLFGVLGCLFSLIVGSSKIHSSDENYTTNSCKVLVMFSAAILVFSVASAFAVWSLASYFDVMEGNVLKFASFSAIALVVAYNELSVFNVRMKKLRRAIYEEDLLFGIG